MQTQIQADILHTPQGQEADRILRSCVHCGFCTATCPTYQLLGDELDSPRGRIYLIKQMLEGNPVSHKTQLHLDRCLTCRACETTCPSGVEYGHLVDIGRELVEQRVKRSALESLKRWGLRKLVPYPRRFGALLKLAKLFSPLLPVKLRNKIPPLTKAASFKPGTHPRKMLVLQGCVQSLATPETNLAATQLLDKLGIELMAAPNAGCCGAVNQHLSAVDEARVFVRNNIDAWWPYIESGAEAIVITASGCGAQVKDYGHLMSHDPAYAEKAKRISELARDISQVIAAERLDPANIKTTSQKIAFHSPCTLQHGQQLGGVVESILSRAGFELVEIHDPHLCCGSAGTYSILQPALSQKLLHNKLASLQQASPELIATANIGCQLHLATEAGVPVIHWIELLNEHFE